MNAGHHWNSDTNRRARALRRAALQPFHPLAVALLFLGCATTPQRMSLYTPFPRAEVWQGIERKVGEMGYTTARADETAGVMVVERTDPAGPVGEKQEIQIKLAPDGTGNLKLEVLAARVLLASDGTVARRLAAGRQTTADANAILGVFLKYMR